MAGYSGTPLAKKLGIKEGARVLPIRPPVDYRKLVAPLPAGVALVSRVTDATDIVHVFSTKHRELSKSLHDLRGRIRADGVVWVSWPKKSSKVETDITEDAIRAIAFPLGFVDVKVCAVDDVWSGLKLVVRKELRGALE